MMKKQLLLLFIGIFLFHGAFSQGLRVDPLTSIKIESGTTLKVDNGDIFIESDASGDASLIDIGTISYANGEAKVYRYLTQGKWHLISSPVAGATAAMFENDYLQYHTESSNLYSEIGSLTFDLNHTQGYALWTVDDSPSTELFSGITYTGDKSKSFTQAGAGFNLLGNPYPSVLDWESVNIPAELSGAYWVFDPSIGSEGGDFREYISDGGAANTTTQYIPMGQGFFVRSTGGSGTITFSNDDRTHNAQSFYKGSSETNFETQLVLIKATGNNVTMQTALRFNSNATNTIDRLYDVQKVSSGNIDIPIIYSKCEGQNMAINTIPSMEGNEVIPLYFEAGISGAYSFDAVLENVDSNTEVYLEDLSTNFIQNLRQFPHYAFQYETGKIKNFNLKFKDVTGMDELETNAIQCYMANDMIYVNISDQDFGKAQIEVFNLAGKSMLFLETADRENAIPFFAAEAIYLVMVTNHKHVYSTKVFNN